MKLKGWQLAQEEIEFVEERKVEEWSGCSAFLLPAFLKGIFFLNQLLSLTTSFTDSEPESLKKGAMPVSFHTKWKDEISRWLKRKIPNVDVLICSPVC